MLRIAVVLFVAAIVITFVGIELLESTRVTAAGVLVIGATALVAGIEMVRTGRAVFESSGPRETLRPAEDFTGIAARMWGVIFLIAGLLTIIGAAATVVSPERTQATVLAFMETRQGQGAGIAFLGTLTTLYGIIRTFGGSGWRITNVYRRTRDVGYRLLGIVCILIGGALIALGGYVMTLTT